MDGNRKNEQPILQALRKIQGSGCYHFEGEHPFLFPGIGLRSGEELAFPLPPAQAKAIKAEAEAAPYGKGSATVSDETVRKCWQIDAGDLDWSNPGWPKAISRMACEAAKGLGVEGNVVAEPYKLLLYEKGGFFLPHRDTEKIPAMFASLIVNLPSPHQGGQLVIRHDERVETVDFSKSNPRGKIRYSAFFADCEHEILPVTKGFRLCLVYNLAIKKGRKSIPNPAPSGHPELLLPPMRQLAEDRAGDLSAILLDHRYTKANVKIARLKGDDRARASALFGAAERTGFAARLALVSLYRMGELEDGFGYSRGYRSSSHDDEGEMGEIFDETLSVDGWRTPADKVEKLGSFSIDESQIISPEKFGDGIPDEKFAEGFTGNAGCTMEHWYHRAAIVLWQKDKEHQILARYNFTASCQRFEELAARKRPPALEITELGTALIEEGRERLEKSTDYQLSDLAQQSLPIIAGIAKVKSRTLFTLCQGPLLSNVLTVAEPGLWKALFDAFGAEAVDAFFKGATADTMKVRKNSLFAALSAALAGKRFKEQIASPIADRLMDLFSNPAEPEEYYCRQREQVSRKVQHVHVAIAASPLMASKPGRERLREFLWSGGTLPHIRTVLGPALLQNTHRRHFPAPGSVSFRLLTDSIEVLQAETQNPLAPYPDWSRPLPEPGQGNPGHQQGGLIDELTAFVKDAGSKEYRFRVNQQCRSTLENYILNHRLDIDFHTNKQGTPYTLVCRKNDQSYRRLVDQRSRDKKLLEKLLTRLEKQS